MDKKDFSDKLKGVIRGLSDVESLQEMFHEHDLNTPLPSGERLEEIVAIVRAVLFPGYYGETCIQADTLEYHIGMGVERLLSMLSGQIMAGLCFPLAKGDKVDDSLRSKARELAVQTVEKLPELRRVLATDVEATYNGDPAARNRGEVIACYPVVKALVNYRLAHELDVLGVPLIPRMLTEMAHSETGIDIHPSARIGDHFTIDHGTGVVIGATCIIGSHVKLYQGVTLGARSFPLDENGNPIKGIDRHPVIGNGVIIYSNATILGRVNIGDGAVIGANVWVTRDVEAGEHVRSEK